VRTKTTLFFGLRTRSCQSVDPYTFSLEHPASVPILFSADTILGVLCTSDSPHAAGRPLPRCRPHRARLEPPELPPSGSPGLRRGREGCWPSRRPHLHVAVRPRPPASAISSTRTPPATLLVCGRDESGVVRICQDKQGRRPEWPARVTKDWTAG
jgi:hypothetical protein